MKKLSAKPLSGTQEFLPADQHAFDAVKSTIAETFRRHGFAHIETPAIDRLDVLLAKAGGETEKQIFKVIKTSESSEDATQGLRFDHTVPLARYVAEHENSLTFPLKVYQIGRNWRGERAQKGRFREFYQCDVDVIGRGQLDISADADVITTLAAAYRHLGLSVVCRLSNRKLISGVFSVLNIAPPVSDQILHIIDRSEKVSPEATAEDLNSLGLPAETVEILERFMSIRGSRGEVMDALKSLGIDDPVFQTGIQELDLALTLLEAAGLASSTDDSESSSSDLEPSQRVMADLRIVRGLDYYTGTVFEFALAGHPEIGSIGGGGRYEQLAAHFTSQNFPGVGGSIGLSRLFFILQDQELLSSDFASTSNSADVAIIPVSEAEVTFAFQTAAELQAAGQTVTMVHLGHKKLSDRLTYASKVAKKAIVLGETEAASGHYEIKEFK